MILFLIRSALVFVWVAFSSCAGMLYCILHPRDLNNVHKIAQNFYKPALKILGIQHTRRNFENMKSPSIIVGNHQHIIDVFTMAAMVPERTISIGKKEIKWIPFFNLMFHLSGNLYIDRQNLRRALSTMKMAGDTVVSQGLSVWMFPEGTRRFGKGLGPFKKGAFQLALQAQVPVQPVVSNSLEKTVDMNKWNAGRVIVKALEPIPTKGLSMHDMDSLIEKTHKAMKEAIEKLDQELMG